MPGAQAQVEKLWRLAVQNGYDFPLGLITMYEKGEPDPTAFSPKAIPVKSLWIVGEIIAGLQENGRSKTASLLSSLGRILFPGPDVVYDDFRWGDPLAVAAEAGQYLWRFWKSGLSFNPVEGEMMR